MGVNAFFFYNHVGRRDQLGRCRRQRQMCICASVTEAVLTIVGQSQGLTILPAWTALSQGPKYGLITRPIGDGALTTQWYLAGLHQVANREAILEVMQTIQNITRFND